MAAHRPRDDDALTAWQASCPGDLLAATWASLSDGEDLPPLTPGFLRRLTRWGARGEGLLVIRGEVGFGRDRVAAALAHQLAADGGRVPVFLDWPTLRLDADDAERRRALEAAVGAGLAVVLDIGAGGAGDAWERPWVERLAEARHGAGTPTIVTTTLSSEGLDLFWGEAVARWWADRVMVGTASR